MRGGTLLEEKYVRICEKGETRLGLFWGGGSGRRDERGVAA